MLDRIKAFWQGVMLAPFINLFIKVLHQLDVITVVGTLGVSAGALVFFPEGTLGMAASWSPPSCSAT